MASKRGTKDRVSGESPEAIARNCAFDSKFLDFEHGIRVGLLDPSQRITQILKSMLQLRHGVEMVCDRWGRGVYWQWICWVPKPNRDAKPESSGFNFASAKFFISLDREDRIFQSGFQVERAPKAAGADDWGVQLAHDWDWHVLLKALAEAPLQKGIKRLLGEGFRVRTGAFGELVEYDRRSWDPAACRRRAQRFSPREWGGFQLFWPMPEKEVRRSSGRELVQAVMAVFDEIAPVMNLCLYAPCLTSPGAREDDEVDVDS